MTDLRVVRGGGEGGHAPAKQTLDVVSALSADQAREMLRELGLLPDDERAEISA